MSAFELDPRLAGDTLAVLPLTLCDVRLMDDARYPWLVLVPRRAEVAEILDLHLSDRKQLHEEIVACSRALTAVFTPDKLNVAALGNVVAQLHVHVIARFKADDAWPRPVWGVHPPRPYERTAADALIERLKEVLSAE